MAIELKLPAVSADMEYGTITRWLKAEGDRVAKDEPVVEVEAEKVDGRDRGSGRGRPRPGSSPPRATR